MVGNEEEEVNLTDATLVSDDNFCEAQARVRQGSARDGSQGERPQSLNPCLELTLKLVVTHLPPKVSFSLTNGLIRLRWARWR